MSEQVYEDGVDFGEVHGRRTLIGQDPERNGASESIGTLITGLIEDLQGLLRGEIALAKTELKEDVSSVGQALVLVVAGAIVGLTGFIFLMLGVTYLLNKSVEMWLAAGIVGTALLVVAGVVAVMGKMKLSGSTLKPRQTIDSLKEDQAWAKRQINSVKR
jgi:uncharacterized membrane protein YqjE